MHRKPFNLILLGDPASGKGTHSRNLIRKYHFYNLDMGKEVRKPAIKALHDYARTTGKGKLTPTHVVRKIFHRVISTVPPGRGILFNGNPKMIGEARLVAKWLKQYGRRDPLVIYLHIPMHEMLRRTGARREYIGGRLVKRDDDSAKALKNRMRYYEKQIAQVVVFFKKKYVFKKISSYGSKPEVWKKIMNEVDRYEASSR